MADAAVDELVEAAPCGGRGGGERGDGDGRAALGEAASEEVKIQLDQGLPGVEGDDG